MKSFGMFQAPVVSPERSPRDTFDWLVSQASAADRAGFTEFWCGEHCTTAWETVPSPELVLAAAIRETDNIILAPGAHLLPYHHPSTLAMQVAWMTHLTEGRYILGIGAGTFPADAYLRGISDMSENHKMVVEALDIMHRIWKAEPFELRGEYWNAGFPEAADAQGLRDGRPLGGKVDIAVAGLSNNSPSLAFAGKNGYLPLSFFFAPEQITNHWETYEAAATAAGREANRDDHHVMLHIFVGETDEEARRLALAGGMGDTWRDFMLDYLRTAAPAAMTPVEGLGTDEAMEWVADTMWIVGDPDTVAEKIQAIADETGGSWGTTLLQGYECMSDPDPWNRSLELIAQEVRPRLAERGLTAAT